MKNKYQLLTVFLFFVVGWHSDAYATAFMTVVPQKSSYAA